MVALKFLIIFCLAIIIQIKGEDPRKRYMINYEYYPIDELNDNNCLIREDKKTGQQDDIGPFWANRGKRQQEYNQNKLYAEEPHYILLHGKDPFFVTRGKKIIEKSFRGRRNSLENIDYSSPFFAARGKKDTI